MPPLLSDWLLIALDAYTLSVTTRTHLGVSLWGMGLTAVGLRQPFCLPLALCLAALSGA